MGGGITVIGGANKEGLEKIFFLQACKHVAQLDKQKIEFLQQHPDALEEYIKQEEDIFNTNKMKLEKEQAKVSNRYIAAKRLYKQIKEEYPK